MIFLRVHASFLVFIYLRADPRILALLLGGYGVNFFFNRVTEKQKLFAFNHNREEAK